MAITNQICPTCGSPIPPDARRGLCPVCLATSLGAGLFGGVAETDDLAQPPGGPDVPGYRLLRVLGEGAAGEVWLAVERHPPRREVALKILRPELVAGDAAVRFEAEMAALALMDHPGIARVFGSGSTADGRPFFAMERVDGAPITAFCSAQNLGLRERLGLFKQVCEAIAHAHRRGIIHRDLKPSNLLAGDGWAKVIDFGIAKATERLLTGQTLLTQANVLLGTPVYMSPEQAAMRGEAVDTRTDVYSLGVLLYELLTGVTPFSAEEIAALPYDEALKKIRSEDPRRPGTIDPQLPADLDWIVMKALEKNPERRYESADAFARDIGNLLEGASVAARPPTLSYRLRKYVRRHRIPVAAASAVALALVAGMALSLTMFLRAETNAEAAAAAAARAEESEARGRRRFSDDDFTQATPLLDDGRPALAVAHLARALRTDPENHAAATRLLYTLAAEDWAIPHLDFPNTGTSQARFSPDGSRIVVARRSGPGVTSRDPHLRIYDAAGGELLQDIVLDSDHTDLAFVSGGRSVVVVDAGGGIAEWELASGQRLRRLQRAADAEPKELRLSPDGSRFACTYWNRGLLQVWQYESGMIEAEFALADELDAHGSADFSADGRSIAFGFGDTLQLFDLDDRSKNSPEMRHSGRINGVALLPADGRVASWSSDASVRIWDAAAGKPELVLHHEKAVSVGALSPDGSRMLTGTSGGFGKPGIVRLWDTATGEQLGEPVIHPGEIMQVRFSDDGMKAASGSRIGGLGDRAVQVLDAWTGEPLMAPIFHPSGCDDLAFSPDGNFLATGSLHLETTIWSIRPNALRRTNLRHQRPVWRAIFDDSGERKSLYSLTFGGVAQRWDAQTGELISAGETAGPVAVAAHAAAPGGDTLRHGFQFRRWVGSYRHSHPHDHSQFRQTIAPRYSVGGVYAAAASEDGRLLVIGCADGMVRIWSLESGELAMPALPHGGGAVTAVAVDAGATTLASGGGDGVDRLWDLRTGALLGSVRAHRAGVSAIAFSPDGKTVATGADNGEARLWWPGADPATSPLLDNVERVNHVAFSPDGKTLATSGMDNATRLWDASDGRPLVAPMPHIAGCNYGLFLLWSPDGQSLVTAGSSDHTARAWNPHSGRMRSKPMEQPTSTYAVALHPGGEFFLSASQWARVWDLGSGEPLTPLLTQDDRPGYHTYTACFDARGERFATGTLGGNCYLRDLPNPVGRLPEKVLNFAEALAGFRFNSEDILEPVSIDGLAAARREVLQLPTEAAGSDWVRWLAADPGTRTISPFSRVSAGQSIDQLVAENSHASLREALHLRPGDPTIMAALGEQLATAANASARAQRFGTFLVERATAAAPGSVEVRMAREHVRLSGLRRKAGSLLRRAPGE